MLIRAFVPIVMFSVLLESEHTIMVSSMFLCKSCKCSKIGFRIELTLFLTVLWTLDVNSILAGFGKLPFAAVIAANSWSFVLCLLKFRVKVMVKMRAEMEWWGLILLSWITWVRAPEAPLEMLLDQKRFHSNS